MYDYLIVGAGFSGSVLANRIANDLNKKVLVVDKRNHIGGTAYDYHDENGILIHKYGPHIFRTNSAEVWSYLSKYTEWYNYQHNVLAVVEGKKIPIPFNLNSIYSLFPHRLASKLEDTLVYKYGYGQKIPILKLLEDNDPNLRFLSKYIYDNVFYGYTLKQWELKPEELDPSVTSGVPICVTRDNRYFQDTYQGIPRLGYTKLFENLLNHPCISILLGTDYKDIIDHIKFNRLLYTGPIDEYFDFIEGELPYRSVTFKFEYHETEFYQECAVVNYPNDFEFTRISEFKYFHPAKRSGTAIGFEYPTTFSNRANDRYYPVPRKENTDIYERYYRLLRKYERINMIGRLAEYRYYSMNEVVARALNLFENQISKY